jgi:hypothetical protein
MRFRLHLLRPAGRLVAVLGVALLSSATLAAPASARDPFLAPGEERVRIATQDDAVVRMLDTAGFVIEERTRTDVVLRTDAAARVRLDQLGLAWSRWIDPAGDDEDGDRAFTTHAAMTTELQQLAAAHPTLTHLESLGTSVQGREIWALQVSASPGVETVEPEVRIVGNHHGNEKMSVEICMNLAHLLLEGYGIDPTITTLVDTREIWIVPMLNPDGHTANSRYNAHGVDLNRNYGYMWENAGSAAFSEPETRAMRELGVANEFSLSLSFHTSGDIVNSVWNYTPEHSQDDAVVWRLTEDYAAYNGYWAVRGWYWYETHGDCNDWSYGARGSIDWTIETENSDEPAVWEANRPGILHTIEAAGWGIHGRVHDAVSGAPVRALAFVEGNAWPAATDPSVGDFHKTLLAGTYDLRITANGYADLVVPGVVVPTDGGVSLDLAMFPGGGRYADRVEQANAPDPSNLYQNATLSMSALGAPDGVGYALGRGGNAVLDFGPDAALVDGIGDDLVVHESGEDGLVERCRVYAGSAPFGPWTLLGTTEGTASFDLAGTGLTAARFVRLEDDGDGSYSGAFPGYEVDALESLWRDPASVDPDGPEDVARVDDPAARLRTLAPHPLRAGAVFTLGGTARAGDPFLAGDDVDAGEPAPGQLTAPDFAAVVAPELVLFDVGGRVVRRFEAGGSRAPLVWEARDAEGRPLAPGVYLLRCEEGPHSAARKVVVVE